MFRDVNASNLIPISRVYDKSVQPFDDKKEKKGGKGAALSEPSFRSKKGCGIPV